MPTMQKAFIIQGFTMLGEAESAELIIGNVDSADVTTILHDLRLESELQRETEVSHSELSKQLADMRVERDDLNMEVKELRSSYADALRDNEHARSLLSGALERTAHLSRENIEFQNKLAAAQAQIKAELRLLAILCCERVKLYYVDGDKTGEIEFRPSSIELNGELEICGRNGSGAIRRFTTDQISSFTVLPNERSTATLPKPFNA